MSKGKGNLPSPRETLKELQNHSVAFSFKYLDIKSNEKFSPSGWFNRGEWNWDLDKYEQVADCFKEAATEYDVKIVWGGDWTSLKDGPHIQLDWNAYPAVCG